jgi:hypothetical protein
MRFLLTNTVTCVSFLSQGHLHSHISCFTCSSQPLQHSLSTSLPHSPSQLEPEQSLSHPHGILPQVLCVNTLAWPSLFSSLGLDHVSSRKPSLLAPAEPASQPPHPDLRPPLPMPPMPSTAVCLSVLSFVTDAPENSKPYCLVQGLTYHLQPSSPAGRSHLTLCATRMPCVHLTVTWSPC